MRPFRVAIVGTGHDENSLGWQFAYNQIYDLLKDPDMPLLVSLELINRTTMHAERLRTRIIEKFNQDNAAPDLRQSIDDLVKISDIETIKNTHCLEDLAIITIDAGKYKQRGSHTRLSDIQYNLKPVTDVAEQFKGYKGKVIMVTNPVDILAYVFAAYSSIGLHRILAFHPETYRYVEFLEQVCKTTPPYGYCAASLVDIDKSAAPDVEGFVLGNHEGEYKDREGNIDCESLGILSQTKIGPWLIYALPEDVQLTSINAPREIEGYVNKKMFAKEGETADGSDAVKRAIAKGFAPMLKNLIKSIVIKNKYVICHGILFKFSNVKCSEEAGYKDPEYLNIIKKDPISISGYPFVSTPSGFGIMCDDARFNLSYEKKEFQTFLRYFKNGHDRIEALLKGELRDKDGTLMVHKWWDGNKEKTNNIPLKIDKQIVETEPTQFQSVGTITVSGKKFDFDPSTVLFAADLDHVFCYGLNNLEKPLFKKRFDKQIFCVRYNVVDGKEKLFLGTKGQILILDYPKLDLEQVVDLSRLNKDFKDAKVRDIDFTHIGFIAACDHAGIIGLKYAYPNNPYQYTGTQGDIKSVKVMMHNDSELIFAPGRELYCFISPYYDNCISLKTADHNRFLRSVTIAEDNDTLNLYATGQYAYLWMIQNLSKYFNNTPVKSKTRINSYGAAIDFYKRGNYSYILLGTQDSPRVIVLDARTLNESLDLFQNSENLVSYDPIGFLKVFRSNGYTWLAVSRNNKGRVTKVPSIEILGLDLDIDKTITNGELKGIEYLCIADTKLR